MLAPMVWRGLVVFVLVCAACTAPADNVDDVDAGDVDGGAAAGEGEGEPLPLRDLVQLGDAVVVDEGPVLDPVLVPAVPAGIEVVDLGNLVVDAAGNTGAFTIDIDARITAVSVLVYADASTALAMLTSVVSPDGVIVDDTPLPTDAPGFGQMANLSQGFTGQFASPARVLPAQQVGSFIVPSTSDVPLSPGRWRLRAGQADRGTDAEGNATPVPRAGAVRVLVLLKTTPTTTSRARLAFLFSGSTLTASTATNDANFVSAVRTVQQRFAEVGIDLGQGIGDVDLADVPAEQAQPIVVLDLPRCDGAELDAVSALGRNDRLNVVVIDRFECGAFGPFLLGMSTGLPLLPFAGGTLHSSVVVAGSFFVDEADTLATVIAHELGHGLGLFHAQENDRFGADIFDIIADTPNDNAEANIMFFDLSRATSTSFSAGQGSTMRLAPQVQP